MTPLQGKCFGTNCSFKSLFSTSFSFWIPPPFHLPAVLVKPGPQRHLPSVKGSWDGPGASPHLPCFTMGGRVAFWLLSGDFVLEITYQAARELRLWSLCDLSSGTAGTGGKNKSCGITIQGQVSSVCKPSAPALSNHVTPTSLSCFWTQLRLLLQVVWKTCAMPGRPKTLHQHLSVPFPVLLTGEGQPRESQRQSPDLGKMACFSPHKRDSPTRTDHTSAHDEPQQSPPLQADRPGARCFSLSVPGTSAVSGDSNGDHTTRWL